MDGGNDSVVLVVDGDVLTCDKAMLVNGSDYFRAMFDSDMVETQTHRVMLPDQDVSIMKALIGCLSTGELTIRDDNIIELTEASVRFQMQSITDTCVNYMRQRLGDDSCLEMMKLAESLNLSNLNSIAKRHALYYFSKVITHNEFLEQDVDFVISYLSNRQLHCPCELDILSAIEVWIRHELEHRECHLSDLLKKCFHPEDLDSDEKAEVETFSILKNTESGQRLLQELQEKNIQASSFDKKYHQMPVTILSVGERIREDGHLRMDVWKLCNTDKTMKPFDQFNCNPIGSKVVVIGKDFYITGGQTNLMKASFMKDIWKFDGFEKMWENISEIPVPMRHHAACASSNKIFLLGGFGKYREVLDSVQEYDIEKNTWRKLPNMVTKGYALHAEYSAEKLYLCREMQIECLDLHTLVWTNISLHTFIGSDTVSVIPIAFKNYIYLFKHHKYYHVAGEGELFTETWRNAKEWTRFDIETLEFSTYPCNEQLDFGHRMTVCDGLLYMLNYSTNNIVCTDLRDLTTFTSVGTSGVEDDHCSLVVLPDY